MNKKHKFIDTLKSWLLTLGVASVFGLVALGFNATKTYTKTSAYDYQEDGIIVFSSSSFDIGILYNYYSQYNVNTLVTSIFDNHESGLTFDYLVSKNLESRYVFLVNYSEFSDDNISYRLLIDYGNQDLSVYDDDAGETLTIDSLQLLFGVDGYQELRNYALSYNAPQSQGNFLSALTDFMQLLGGAIVQLAQPIANGVTEFARDLFIDNNHLSILGGVIGIFAGIALAVGITTKVYTWVTSLGN